MPLATRVLMIFAIGACLVYCTLNSYQALTGRRVSKRPSRRTDQEMRRQSAIAAVVLGAFGLLDLLLLLISR